MANPDKLLEMTPNEVVATYASRADQLLSASRWFGNRKEKIVFEDIGFPSYVPNAATGILKIVIIDGEYKSLTRRVVQEAIPLLASKWGFDLNAEPQKTSHSSYTRNTVISDELYVSSKYPTLSLIKRRSFDAKDGWFRREDFVLVRTF